MSKKSQFGMTLLLSTILVGGANASTVPSSSTFGVAQVTQQGAVCKGVVKDAAGEPIIGATVKVKGSEKTGAVTDLDGVFTLSGVEKGQTVVVSYIGYVTQEVKFKGQPLDVVIYEDSKTLNEVVVVGYGTTSKRKTTSAISSVKADDIAKVPVPNITQSFITICARGDTPISLIWIYQSRKIKSIKNTPPN